MELVRNNLIDKQFRLLGIKTAAKYLGVSINTLYQWRSQGKIPYVKIHGRLLFDFSDLNNLIKECTHKII